ncbi:Protein of unknown function (DUF707) [Owenweeksia hongkongensis DSM 17368]|uniref:DUF707 domain-containing protein n=1 Tax=Owenweeksia hongkongensis (strain DSM 17368 / CIP 108786 / JCM 12287 / NRRL B-23963 / UST20020801) TaxID=926562 RepID=G8R1V7_OWEHD|nr:DUF707 domain-containing protein [Owenweeksia hongkongensis]AEV33907.1 Protein of unknown function (DUF707) [Owenweeksia hongkongensis DSM 17368]
MQKNKYLVVSPCGDKSELFKTDWIDTETHQGRDFDLVLLYYHPEVKNQDAVSLADYFFHLKDYKYKMIYNLFTNIKPELLGQYDYFFFLDDDIKITQETINRSFHIADLFKLLICQPSLTSDSFCSWPILKNKAGSFLRFMGEVEVMAPIFSREALTKCLPSFVENDSSWGLDTIWTYLLKFPKDKIAVLDAVQMKHTNPVGEGELYAKLKHRHQQEWVSIQKKYGIKKHYFTEFSRLEWSNRKYNKLNYLKNKLSEKALFAKQKFNDYGLKHRIKSRVSKVLNTPKS